MSSWSGRVRSSSTLELPVSEVSPHSYGVWSSSYKSGEVIPGTFPVDGRVALNIFKKYKFKKILLDLVYTAPQDSTIDTRIVKAIFAAMFDRLKGQNSFKRISLDNLYLCLEQLGFKMNIKLTNDILAMLESVGCIKIDQIESNVFISPDNAIINEKIFDMIEG